MLTRTNQMKRTPLRKKRLTPRRTSGYVASPAEYKALTLEMARRQDFRCAICGERMLEPTFDHEAGRGMGGHRRTDAILNEDGTWLNAAVHYTCNSIKGSKRYSWQYGRYEPVRRVEP